MKTLDKTYNPAKVEPRWSEHWIEKGLFRADTDSRKPVFSMVIPPPNITGSLHCGHALNSTLQDVLARYKRMKGFNVLWLPGIDHAGIATQNVVERMLAEEGLTRERLGRERFLERVWKWKEESGGRILEQLKRLGASCDWTRLRFTMDEGLSRAVREVFVRLFSEGLIYRGDYIINWCPRCHTALSDLEVQHEERDGFLYYLVYPLKDGKKTRKTITVATTRPETMLGDTAVAVNPSDKRYASLIGTTIILPLVNREIPLIGDNGVDMEFGTGAVKVTPAHDFNDFEMARRHDLECVRVMDLDGRMNENAGRFKGLDRFRAREAVVEALREEGFVKKVDNYRLLIGTCYRCGTTVEPTLSKQWFVDVKPLAEPAIKAVEEGRIVFIPRSWENTYFEWMRNIRDWCISRQIWWGHRIPAWYCKRCEHTTVATTDPSVCEGCGSEEIYQDEDVLDTWFSSALWPFSTLGWPQRTKDLEMFYPTTVLSTGFDIIFFWVARMIMMGLKFMGDVPFRDVYIHALIRDAEGQKMSKSRGNVIDPLVMMERYGTDAFRYTLVSFAAQGRDIKLSEDRIEGYRNFSNKLWNLARFVFMNLEEEDLEEEDLAEGRYPDTSLYNIPDRWILTRLKRCADEVSKGIETYNFDESARSLYRFIWHELCDWYVELVKPDIKGERGEERRKVAVHVLTSVLRDTLKLLHPFMPFITEEIFSYMKKRDVSIMETGFPEPDLIFPEEEAEMERIMSVVRAVRNIRTEMNIPHRARVDCLCLARDDSVRGAILTGEAYIKDLAGVENLRVEASGEGPRGSVSAITDGVEVFVPISGHVDLDVEEKRLKTALKKLLGELSQVQRKLANEDFLNRAPREVVAKEKRRLEELLEKKGRIETGIERIRTVRG